MKINILNEQINFFKHHFQFYELIHIKIILFHHGQVAESFVAVCDMLLKFHNLSAKFYCIFNE